MWENPEQLYNFITPQVAESAESATALEGEGCLTTEIMRYWEIHVHCQGSLRETNRKAREIRAHLARLLFQLKQELAQPGRNGRWSSFLKDHGIPRATADRMVARHQRSLEPGANRLTEAISVPTPEQVRKLFMSVWPRLSRVLVTPCSLYQWHQPARIRVSS